MTSSDSARELPRPTALERMTWWDRAAEDRIIAKLLPTVLADPATRVLAVAGDRVPLADGGLSWDTVSRWVDPAAPGLVEEWAFLGRDENGAAVVMAVLAADAAAPGDDDTSVTYASLRTATPSLHPAEAALAVTAVSLGRWHIEAPFCAACGARTEVLHAGWSRHCPSCGREHFPRTDPAVIVAVTHPGDPDLLLLGSNAAWTEPRYSCFAGFVEAGESLEGAVHREIREEAGVEVGEVRYQASQAWPYPRSLMVGFTAEAVDAGMARPDGDEIVSVRWFHRREIGEALGGRGDLLLPGPASIAHRLISDWHAAGSP
ncbi:NAD(+) diphosphatase [Microbacterium sp. ET2]|uniref:NAD(+) diphosphatase n=1 Tax=Microbacterium albipurpureum TaxID=3050384 RepID=UPI00259CE90F|nr:NAD(+) diphosphatase [Microbacterium sp. ET2 (Ac-2212)]WJL95923.1 NAD(+) diphosphatase [Microbacterium sp. ET2 (Ac-2212)]